MYPSYSQEGKYHHDGHRKCDIAFEPEITKKHNSMCPECGKPLTVGVLHRVVDLADRQQPQKPREAADYRYIIPLPEVLGEIEGVGPKTKTVRRKYRDVISNFGNEFDLLHQVPIEEIEKKNGAVLAEAVRRIRDNDVNPKAGYDGVFGVIKVFEDGEIERIRGQLGFFGIDEYKVDEKQQQAAEREPNAYEQDEEQKTGSEAPYALNPQQQKVKDSLRGTTLVKAGPGTGKTHTLVEWIVNQVERGQQAPDQVMAVTFTNKSAEELQLRLTNRLGSSAKRMTIGTFHAIAWQLLKELRPNIHTIYDRGARRMTLRFLFPELSGSERKRFEEDLLHFFELGTELSSDFKDYARRYQDYLEENGAVDLSNIINRLVSVIKDENGIRIQLQNRFKAIAVDELQDINPVQYEMVELLGGGDEKSVLAIGDPDQSIYGFRGSDLSLFFKFGRKFEANEIELSRNYRSTGNILEAAGSVIDHNGMKSGVALRASKEKGRLISVHRAANPFAEADYILDQVERYIGGIDSLASGTHTDSQHSYGLGDIAVLYRTNAVGESLFKAFLKAGIPVNFGDGTPFLTEPPFTVIANLLQLKLNPGNKMALSDLLSEAYGWSDAQITSLLNAVCGNEWSLFGDKLVENIADPLQEDLENLKKIYADITEHIESSRLTSAVRLACKEFMPEDLLTGEQLRKKETLLELAEESDQDLEHFLEQMQLNPYTDAGRLKSEGVHLLTFHAAKGLEFPVVLIAAAEEEIAPILREDTDMEEERRLFYVAMTRAEEELQITYTAERSRYGEMRKMEASRFISEIPEHLKEVSGDEEAETEGEKEETHSEQLGLF
jgi:superfamily I DNA/RNA helicase